LILQITDCAFSFAASAVPPNAPGASNKLHKQQSCIQLKNGKAMCDEIVEFAGYRIFGSPWTPAAFYGQWQVSGRQCCEPVGLSEE
jgi:hypothetical protein